MGVKPGIEVKLIKYAPMGDPLEIRIHDYELTLRLADAEQIEVSDKKSDEDEHRKDNKKDKALVEHPGLGEGGKYHVKADEHPLPKDEILTFALVGNQNCGKTTLFNQLTGSNQHVGNFPGVTVDRKEGMIKGYPDTRVTDLPGVYLISLTSIPGITPMTRKCCLSAPSPPTVQMVADCPSFKSLSSFVSPLNSL